MNKFASLLRQYSYGQYFLGFCILIIILVLAIRKGYTEDELGDFFIFWNAGVNFTAGNPLYSQFGGAAEFLYPPVAPFVFQLLSWLPFHVAASVFSFFNLSVWFIIGLLSKKILAFYFPRANLKYAFIFGILASARFFWHNFLWVNINELVILLCLFGIYNFIHCRENTALSAVIIAAYLKVMPALFVLLFILRGGKKNIWKAIGIAFIPLLLLVLQRGWQRGLLDIQEYLIVILKPFTSGKVYTEWISLSIPSMIAKIFTKYNDPLGMDFHLFELSASTAGMISKTLQCLVLFTLFYIVIKHRIMKTKKLTLQEICLTFLTMPLIAGVSWEGHHVSMMLVYPAVFMILTHTNQIKLRHIFIGLCIFIGLIGKDTVGEKLYNASQGYSFITFLMIFTFVILFNNRKLPTS